MKNILIFAISMILASCSVPVNKPKVINGTLDLRNWNLQENGTVQLDGEWEFYWEKFLKPGEIISGSPEYLKVPGLWNGFKRNGSTVGNLGFATYRLKILLNPAEKKLAVRLPSISSSYELFINGDSIFSAGKPGRSRSEMIPEYKPQYIDIPVTSDALVFIFNVSNFQHTKGGLWKSIQIGAKEDIRSSRRRHLFTDLFLSGSLFIMGLYHIGLFILRKKSISPLLFGIFCM
ncbi:MAG: hypothetical protein K8R21_04370, partial [Leptospira sp.]|nr:hypothetical protein [Leptospira sp.]